MVPGMYHGGDEPVKQRRKREHRVGERAIEGILPVDQRTLGVNYSNHIVLHNDAATHQEPR